MKDFFQNKFNEMAEKASTEVLPEVLAQPEKVIVFNIATIYENVMLDWQGNKKPVLEIHFSLPFLSDNKIFHIDHPCPGNENIPKDNLETFFHDHAYEMLEWYLGQNHELRAEVLAAIQAELVYLEGQQLSLQKQLEYCQQRTKDLQTVDL